MNYADIWPKHLKPRSFEEYWELLLSEDMEAIQREHRNSLERVEILKLWYLGMIGDEVFNFEDSNA